MVLAITYQRSCQKRHFLTLRCLGVQLYHHSFFKVLGKTRTDTHFYMPVTNIASYTPFLFFMVFCAATMLSRCSLEDLQQIHISPVLLKLVHWFIDLQQLHLCIPHCYVPPASQPHLIKRREDIYKLHDRRGLPWSCSSQLLSQMYRVAQKTYDFKRAQLVKYWQKSNYFF